MGNSITPSITITISGYAGAGKTTLLHEIGHLLKLRGFNVRCLEKISRGIFSEQYECSPNHCLSRSPNKPDDRLIEIVAQN